MDVRKLIISQALCFGTGGISAAFTMQSADTWYRMLKKPFFFPPEWSFGPVWTVLYLLMGLSLYIVWSKRQGREQNTLACLLFGLQLILSIGCFFIFFGLRSILGGFVALLALWLAVTLTIHEFLHKSQMAGWLMIPYLVWVSYICILICSMWWLNSKV